MDGRRCARKMRACNSSRRCWRSGGAPMDNFCSLHALLVASWWKKMTFPVGKNGNAIREKWKMNWNCRKSENIAEIDAIAVPLYRFTKLLIDPPLSCQHNLLTKLIRLVSVVRNFWANWILLKQNGLLSNIGPVVLLSENNYFNIEENLELIRSENALAKNFFWKQRYYLFKVGQNTVC